jgi:tetratricopeptide (TPR) repeat protein
MLVLVAAALAASPDVAPEHQTLDLLRPTEDFPRIYVQARLPDGELGTFLIDTGADISVLSEATAARLGLTVERGFGMLSGLSGSTPMHRALIPELGLGDVVFRDVEVAVGVPGVTDEVAFMAVDGLLGNNVWGRFTLEIDYPADTLVLHTPGAVKLPRKASAMHFDGHHVFAPIAVRTNSESPIEEMLVAQIDTGASGLTLCAATGLPFADATTEGLETLRGIGASETLPPYRFLETTRRIPLSSLALGGATTSPDGASARWVDFHDTRSPTCRAGMRALLGHEYLAEHRVMIDYAEGLISLTRSTRKPRSVNGHTVLLAQDKAAHGDDADRGLIRAKYLLGADDEDAAVQELRRFVEANAGGDSDRAEARMLLSAIARSHGRLSEAYAWLSALSPGDLVDQEQIIASVNGLLFEGQRDEAVELARAAVAERPNEGDAHVALADALLATNAVDGARDALLRAAELEQYPDAHLIRRARVAYAAGDRHGAMAHVRKLMQLYPFGGHFLWFYAHLLQTEGDRNTFRADMNAAMARLHPDGRPYDFLVAAHQMLGDDADVARWRATGVEAHCEPMEGPGRENCFAWYDALAGVDLDRALERIDKALAAEGERSDFLDTKAMVHLARRELPMAREAALQAARMSPDDVYMLWQAERISDIAAGVPAGRPSTQPTAASEAP